MGILNGLLSSTKPMGILNGLLSSTKPRIPFTDFRISGKFQVENTKTK
jgi:hypothetical protein